MNRNGSILDTALTRANRGDAVDQVFAGTACLRGRDGVLRDPVQALERYRKAVAQRDRDGRYHLAFLNEEGKGVPQEEDEVLR